MRNQLAWLRRLRAPKICHLQTGDPGRPMTQFSLSPKSREPGTQWWNKFPVQGQRWVGCPSLATSPSLCLLFHSGPQWIGWCPASLGRTTHQIKCQSHPKTPSQTQQEKGLIWASCGQSSWYIKLTTTLILETKYSTAWGGPSADVWYVGHILNHHTQWRMWANGFGHRKNGRTTKPSHSSLSKSLLPYKTVYINISIYWVVTIVFLCRKKSENVHQV